MALDASAPRESGLLQKFLASGRLSSDEAAEIAHILPIAVSLLVKPKANGYLRSADDYTHLGVARRTFFRWKSAGESNADGPDLPPFDDPQHLEDWYDRMRSRGAFKHKFPKDLRLAITEHLRGSPPSARSAPSSSSVPSKPTDSGTAPAVGHVPSAFTADHGIAQGLQFEIAAEEKRVASLRVARDECYQNKQLTEGDAHDRRYREALDALSLIQQRYLKIAEQEARLVPVDLIEREFAPKLSAVVTSGMLLFDRIASKLREAPDHASGRAIWRRAWIEHCAGLVEGRFAPPLNLESLAA
jgi:hypothetical protein